MKIVGKVSLSSKSCFEFAYLCLAFGCLDIVFVCVMPELHTLILH